MLWGLTLFSTAALYWIYDGYGRCLHLLTWLRLIARHDDQRQTDLQEGVLPAVTVLLTVHNEEALIRSRLENLLSCDYPPELMSILVASDGSTDATNDIVRSMCDPRIRLFDSPGLGKSATQNAAIQDIRSEIIVFTDAGIQFDASFFRILVRRFSDPLVGAVDGRLLYVNPATDTVQASQGYYWNYELKLRHLESQLGILAVVAGGCFAIRRSLFLEMDPAIGEDCIVPLDIAAQGFRVVHDPSARAFDTFESDSGVTLRRRVRMTLRNWQGTWTRSELLNPFRHPGYAFALWSHKLMRWLSPVFLACASLSALTLLMLQPNVLTVAAFAPFAILFALAACGWLTTARGGRLPVAGTAYSFILANMAFLIGIWRAVTGHRIHSYRNT